MKKLFLLLIFLHTITLLSAQYRESETTLQKLVWDDEKLNIMLDMRVDGQFSTGNDDGKELGFRGQTMKIWVAGEIVPGVRYRVRHRLNKSQSVLRDNFAAATDHAWIAIDAGRAKEWTFTIGKQSVQFGTFEYDYSSGDIYLSTMSNSELDNYKTGVNVAYRISGQTFNLQVFNSDADQFAREDYKNKALAAALLWEGSLMDGFLKTRWGYAAFMHTKTRFYNWGTFGVQLNWKSFIAEADYYIGTRNADYGGYFPESAGISTGLRRVRDQSAAMNLRFLRGKWHPSVKGVWDQRYDNTVSSQAFRNFGVETAIEYYPFTNKYLKDLRFHAAYYYKGRDFTGIYASQDGRNFHTALIGIRWFFKAK